MTCNQDFGRLGFAWTSPGLPLSPPGASRRALFRYRQSLVKHVHDASRLEGNPFTYPEVQTLMDGVTVGGHRIDDARQVLNLAEAANRLFTLVETRRFRLVKPVSDRLHALTARQEALEWGNFRGEGEEVLLTPRVMLGHREHVPPLTEPGGRNLAELYSAGLSALARVEHPCERAMAYFLFAALHQFYFDGNKRTGRFMMNGELMMHGWDAISVPAARAREFNETMVRFYTDRDGSGMMEFLHDCRPQDVPAPPREPAGGNEPEPGTENEDDSSFDPF